MKNTEIAHIIIANATSKPCSMKLNCSANKGAVKKTIGNIQEVIVFIFLLKLFYIK